MNHSNPRHNVYVITNRILIKFKRNNPGGGKMNINVYRRGKLYKEIYAIVSIGYQNKIIDYVEYLQPNEERYYFNRNDKITIEKNGSILTL